MLSGHNLRAAIHRMILLACLTGSIQFAAFGGTLVFKGTVLHETGHPAVGAEADLFIVTQADATHAYETTRQTTISDERGDFSFSVDADSDDFRYGHVVVRKDKLALGIARWNMQTDQQATLTLGAPKEISGIVVDEDGRPVSGAKLFIVRMIIGTTPQSPGLGDRVAPVLFSTQTDAQGRFTFDRLPSYASVELFVSKPGRVSINTFDTRSFQGGALQYAVGQTDIRITQPPQAAIEGIVVHKETGQPVGNIGLTVLKDYRALFGQETVYAKEDGTFRVESLPAGQYVIMQAVSRTTMPQWAAEPVEVTLQTGATAADVRVYVSEGGLLEVQALTADTEQPLEHAQLTLQDNRTRQWISAVSNNEGIARLRLPAGTYELSGMYKSGYTSRQQTETVILREGRTIRMTQTLRPSPRISGIVRDVNERPIEGVQIVILPGSRHRTVTDAQGRYEIVWQPPDWGRGDMASCLVARDEARNLAALAEITETQKTLDLKLALGVTLLGTVKDEQNRPIANAEVRPLLRYSMWATSLTESAIKTDRQGKFEVTTVPAGARYTLNISAEGFGKSGDQDPLEADDAKDGRLDVGTITLPTADVSISGTVVDRDGRPVAGTEVYSQSPVRRQTRTDAEGRFVLENLTAELTYIRAEAYQQKLRLSAYLLVKGGTQNLTIVVYEGNRPHLHYINPKPIDQILKTADKVIAGTVVNERGEPVADVPLGVRCHQSQTEDGGMRYHYSSFETLKSVTDSQGRFAIELEEDGTYNLLVSPYDYAADIIYDVPVNQKDLTITLSPGGTIDGRLVRIENGQKVPVPNAEVKIEQASRGSYSRLGFDRDQTATTDAEGRFRFDRLQTQIRVDRSSSTFGPRVWLLSHGDSVETITFAEGPNIKNFELSLSPQIPPPATLTGGTLPNWDGIAFDAEPLPQTPGAVLICVWDFNQRPSRHLVGRLAEMSEQLAERKVATVLIHAGAMDDEAKAYLSQQSLPFVVGSIENDIENLSAKWGVRAMPWLILTDAERTVVAEGFELSDLTEKLNSRP